MNIRFLIVWLVGCSLPEAAHGRMRSRCTQISFRPLSSLRFTRLPFRG